MFFDRIFFIPSVLPVGPREGIPSSLALVSGEAPLPRPALFLLLFVFILREVGEVRGAVKFSAKKVDSSLLHCTVS